jgi:hypothetical protein
MCLCFAPARVSYGNLSSFGFTMLNSFIVDNQYNHCNWDGCTYCEYRDMQARMRRHARNMMMISQIADAYTSSRTGCEHREPTKVMQCIMAYNDKYLARRSSRNLKCLCSGQGIITQRKSVSELNLERVFRTNPNIISVGIRTHLFTSYREVNV